MHRHTAWALTAVPSWTGSDAVLNSVYLQIRCAIGGVKPSYFSSANRKPSCRVVCLFGRGVSWAFEFEGVYIARRKGSSREGASVSFSELGAFGIWITGSSKNHLSKREGNREGISIDKLMV